jgi:hypothetical protein
MAAIAAIILKDIQEPPSPAGKLAETRVAASEMTARLRAICSIRSSIFARMTRRRFPHEDYAQFILLRIRLIQLRFWNPCLPGRGKRLVSALIERASRFPRARVFSANVVNHVGAIFVAECGPARPSPPFATPRDTCECR